MKTPSGASRGATEAYDLRSLIVGISGALASSTLCAHSNYCTDSVSQLIW